MRPIPVSLPEPCVDLCQVSHLGATLDVLTQCHGEAGLGLAEGVVGDDLFEIDGLPGLLGISVPTAPLLGMGATMRTCSASMLMARSSTKA